LLRAPLTAVAALRFGDGIASKPHNLGHWSHASARHIGVSVTSSV